MDLRSVAILFEALRLRDDHLQGAQGDGEAAAAQGLDDALAAFRVEATRVPPSSPATLKAALENLESTLQSALNHAGVFDVDVRAAFRAATATWDSNVATATPSSQKSVAPVPKYKLMSCYVQQQMHRILPSVFLSSFHAAADAALMRAEGITHVCCCVDVSPRFPKEFQYLVIPASDDEGFDLSRFFTAACEFIESARGGNVLVHCGAGISRAPTIVAAYMIFKTGLSARDALLHIKSIRSCVSPNKGFLQQLDQFAKARAARNCLL